jgi:RNA polymerase sigma-70 factor (ECF subfamily)
LDTSVAEELYTLEAGADSAPMRAYERRWALTLVEQALSRLRAEYDQAGRAHEFERLKTFLTAQQGPTAYGPISAEWGLSESAMRVVVHRLRRRFREIFREEVAHTVFDPRDASEEMRHLLAVLTE